MSLGRYFAWLLLAAVSAGFGGLAFTTAQPALYVAFAIFFGLCANFLARR